MQTRLLSYSVTRVFFRQVFRLYSRLILPKQTQWIYKR